MKYRVAWRSLRTRATGQSDGAWSEESAKAWADELNARSCSAQSIYWIVPAEQKAA